jgi:hypothetical protein
MSKKSTCCVLSCLLLCLTLRVFGQESPARAPRPDNPQSLVHIDAAKRIAGNDPYLKYPFDFFCIPSNMRAVVEIPGHTPGAAAFNFSITDHGKTRVAGLFGGTAEIARREVPGNQG